MRVLFIGDVVGKAGVDYVRAVLKSYRAEWSPDLVIANGENAVNGKGLNAATAEALYEAGVELITLGNHTWDQKELLSTIDHDARIVRPANYPPGAPGRGSVLCPVGQRQVLLINLMGRTFLSQLDCPFRTADAILSDCPSDVRHIIVDMHAETTSEKIAMGWYLDGRVSAVVGTHTHVPTSDERVLPKGTGYITDVGMVGPRDGILGMDRGAVLRRMISQLPARFDVARGPNQFCGVLIDLDDTTGRATSIRRLFVTDAS
ncbi:MAG: TIGR00282 family metallophosphoesterase [Alicyclobacillus sp.]|nr:TIGR00282 family metallophosphoesterase [Alicyclobacillus sp.]